MSLSGLSLSNLSVTDLPPTFRETRSVRRNTLFPDALLQQFLVQSRSGPITSSDADTLHSVSESNTKQKSTESNSSTTRKAKASHGNKTKTSTGSKHMRIDTNQNTVHKVERKKRSQFDLNPVVIDDANTAAGKAPRSKPNNDTSKATAPGSQSTRRDNGSNQKISSCDINKSCKRCPATDVNERVNINLKSITTSDTDVRVSINTCGGCQNVPIAEEANVDSTDDPIQTLRNEIMAFRKASPCCTTAPIRIDITPRRNDIPAMLRDSSNSLEHTGSEYLNQLREEIFKYRKMATEHESELAEIRRELKGFRSCPCTSLSDVNEASTNEASASSLSGEEERSTKSISTEVVEDENTDENDYQDARDSVTESENVAEPDSMDEYSGYSSPRTTQSVALEVELRLENLLEEINAEGGIQVTHSDFSEFKDSDIDSVDIRSEDLGNQTELKPVNEEHEDSQDNANGEYTTSSEDKEASNNQDLDTSNQDSAEADTNGEAEDDMESENDTEAKGDAEVENYADTEVDEDVSRTPHTSVVEALNPKVDDGQSEETVCG